MENRLLVTLLHLRETSPPHSSQAPLHVLAPSKPLYIVLPRIQIPTAFSGPFHQLSPLLGASPMLALEPRILWPHLDSICSSPWFSVWSVTSSKGAPQHPHHADSHIPQSYGPSNSFPNTLSRLLTANSLFIISSTERRAQQGHDTEWVFQIFCSKNCGGFVVHPDSLVLNTPGPGSFCYDATP